MEHRETIGEKLVKLSDAKDQKQREELLEDLVFLVEMHRERLLLAEILRQVAKTKGCKEAVFLNQHTPPPDLSEDGIQFRIKDSGRKVVATW